MRTGGQVGVGGSKRAAGAGAVLLLGGCHGALFEANKKGNARPHIRVEAVSRVQKRRGRTEALGSSRARRGRRFAAERRAVGKPHQVDGGMGSLQLLLLRPAYGIGFWEGALLPVASVGSEDGLEHPVW